MALIIGVAGSIATGKSTACKFMTELGAVHRDADHVVHQLYEPGKPAYYRIIDAFGPEIIGGDGFIDRKVLGARVFGSPEEMKKLTDAIGDIGTAVKDVIDRWRHNLADDDVALIEAVNLIEAGYGQWCDQVWLFACSESKAMERLQDRNNLSREEAKKRLRSQRSWEERVPAADCVIFNDHDQADLIRQISREFNHVTSEWRTGGLSPSRYYAWWESFQAQKAAASL